VNGQSAAKRPPQEWRAKLINPVLGKEFTLRMRTPRSMWALFFYLTAIGILAFGFLAIFGLNSRTGAYDPAQSRSMFLFISVAQLGLIAFMTPGLTAGVVSGEREKQTLNLLLVTQQSSTSIILSKLASSLAFMTLLVVSTLPVFSIVFLYGGISPGQVGTVFVFYLFTMLAFGSFGVMFSTFLRRTMLSVITSYGLTVFLYGGTAFCYLVLNLLTASYTANQTSPPVIVNWIGFLLMGINPVAALISIFDSELSDSVFRSGFTGPQSEAPVELWLVYFIIYTLLAVVAILQSIRHIRPVPKKRKRSRKED
jgi:ABC-type transport system involved in multi-copper enzyme maturation permease subunit